MAEYGIPYMGSKGSICDELIKIFPKAENFYDIFGGGFSVTHAMLLRRSRDYKHFHFNEIRPGICELVQSAIAGNYSYENFKPPFVSREEFLEKKDNNSYIKVCWSFGNNGECYLFGKDIEPYKRSMHNAIVFNEFDELAKKTLGLEKFKDGFSIKDKRLFLRNKIKTTKQRLPEFELQQLERLSFYNMSYEKVPIKENSIIYCDPPYKGTADYGGKFDHNKFFDWCNDQVAPVFVSEYNIDDKRFKQVFEIKKRSLLSSTKTNLVKKEKVYVNEAGWKFLTHNIGKSSNEKAAKKLGS